MRARAVVLSVATLQRPIGYIFMRAPACVARFGRLAQSEIGNGDAGKKYERDKASV